MARGDRPALMTRRADDAAGADETRRTVEAVWRIESARIVGALSRYTGDFGLAEDVAQEALAEALASWPRTGVPANPGAWLLTAARRRAIDAYRRRSGLDDRYAAMAHELPRDSSSSSGDLLWDPDTIDDDVLTLMFMACHPVLTREARIALTLRTVGGLTSDEIARAFLISVPTVQARITRAKKTLAAAEVPFSVPPVEERAERLGSVLNVLYVIFTEGSSATSGDEWIRHDLAREALRLGRVLVRLQPVPEAFGLVALLELTSARFPARLDADGRPVLLEDQDRRRWDRSAIARGRAALARAAGPNGLGSYGIQAAIAECHDVAPSVAETDWERIVVHYDALRLLAPSPVVDLNRAVAVSMASGPAAGLDVVDALVTGGALAEFHPLCVVRGELLARLDRRAEARGEFLRAAAMCTNAVERSVIEGKAEAVAPKPS